MKTPYAKLAKIYTKYFGHMTKMPAKPIWLKPFKNLLQNQKAGDLGTWYVAFGMSRSHLLPNAFKWDFFEKLIFLILLKPVIILT